MTLSPGPSERRFCAILGHELRNPLASAMASLSVIEEMTAAGDPRTGFLQRARADLDRLSSLLSSYLDYGTATESYRRRPLDLREFLSDLQVRNDHTVVSVELPSEDVWLKGDRELLGRAIDNLIENALSVGATRIKISLQMETDRAVLLVSDDGPGVPSELTETLFDPFVSGRESSGLGLALCREVLAAHGGTISLDRATPGACFKIVLPAQVMNLATT